MDNPGAVADDDQGSGWLEVKKKHRNSSKFSIQNWVGGFSRQRANGKGVLANDKHRSHNSKPGKDFVQRGGASNSNSLKEKEKGKGKDEIFLDKCVVDDAKGHVKEPTLKIIETASSNLTSAGNDNISEKKLDVVNNIKWGDLEDDDLSPDCGSSSASGIRFGEIGDGDLAMCEPSRNVYDSGTCNLSEDDSVVSKDVVEIVDVTSDTHHKSSSPIVGSTKENCDEVGEVVSNCIIADAEYIDQDHKKLENNDIEPLCTSSCTSSVNSTRLSGDDPPYSSAEESAKAVEVSSLSLSAKVDDVELSAVGADDGNAADGIVTQDSEIASTEQIALEASGNSNTVTGVGDLGDLPNSASTDNVSEAPITRTLEGPDEGESKERFRERLWCFLFENLNRAVDELYLLCELECDLEQVKEAILVLQEAESDFKELHVRVEEFEKMRKNPTQPASGAVMSMKGDQRRPHALSWEVRRMTTSPHRAEILSSSLEAFKKIQEERAKARATGDVSSLGPQRHSRLAVNTNDSDRSMNYNSSELETKSRRQNDMLDGAPVNRSRDRRSIESGRSSKLNLINNNRGSPSTSASDPSTNKLPPKGNSVSSLGGKGKKEQLGPSTEPEKSSNSSELLKRHGASSDKEKEKEKRNSMSWKPADAWKEKRNWEEILASPCRFSSRVSHSPCLSRKSAERARILHDKLMSPEKKKKTAVDLKREAEEKHARAMRIRSELENERVQKLQRTSEKLNRVNEWHAVRSLKLREGMYARHQRSESRHEAHIAQVVRRAGDESIKVNEVRFITSLNEENKKFLLRQKLHDSEMRRAEKIQVMKSKQKEDMAREEAVMGRRKLIEAEKLQRLAETQRRKEEAQLRREEERKASSAAREARTMEQLRRKEERVKAQQEEAELLAQRLAEKLKESEQRRKMYLEQIRERASMDFRDQSSPLMRRSVNKEGRSTPPSNGDDNQANSAPGVGDSASANNNVGVQQSLKRKIKKIRQRLMTLKHEVPETTAGDNVGIGYRTAMATARAKIGRWLQDLQRHRQERKEGAASIGLIAAEMIKFLEGKELELQACRQAGLLDFISSALPASHISKPEACQVTIYLLRLLKVVLSVPANRSYFLAQNLLPPLIPMLAAALESYIKIAASLNVPGGSSLQPSKTSSENFDSISEVLDGFLWTVSMVISHATTDERQLQMQDGLLELVVSYQIIHRLRDLFALYDRPQVEGTPFPSSILLSIKLLVVLTSKGCNVSRIDWECLRVIHKGTVEVSNFVENHNSDLSMVSGVEDNEHGGEPLKAELLDDSTVSGVGGKNEKGNSALELNGNEMEREDLFSQRELGSCIVKSTISQKDEKNSAEDTGLGRKYEQHVHVKQPYLFLLSAISETGLVSLPSLLTAVLLQSNNRLSSEQGSYVLPSNFEEVATGVLKVLNNLALMDITFMQKMLARPDLKMEFFHIMSFLLTHCTNNWKVATDLVGLLLLESLLLLSYFSLFHLGNQAVLRWGKSPTILHKVCDLPFAFFSNPELMPIMAGTLVAACFGCEQNKGVVQQELSTEMILSLVRSCRNSSSGVQSRIPAEDSTETVEPRKLQSEVKPTRSTARNSRFSVTKGGAHGSNGNSRIVRTRNGKTSKLSEGTTSKQRTAASEASAVTLPFYSRFSGSFMDRAEQFFSMEPSNEAHA